MTDPLTQSSTTESSKRGFRPRAIGEIAIRCADLDKMTAFYRNIVGLEILSGDYRDGIVFFRVADGFAGHTTVLALFAGPKSPTAGEDSSLHHLALSLPFDEQPAAMAWLQSQAITYRIECFEWVGWRGIFFDDPEGNTIELVAFDPARSTGK